MKNEKVKVSYDIPTFTIVPHWVADLLKPTELATYVVLGKYADNVTKECWPSLNTIAKDLGRSKPSAIQSIKGLEKKGVLKIEKRKNEKGDWDRNHYTLIVNPPSKENLTTPSKVTNTRASKKNNTTGSKENLTLTKPNITKPNELYYENYNVEKQNAYLEVLQSTFGKDNPTNNEWGQMRNTAKQLFNAGISPHKIPTLVQNMVLTYGEKYTTVSSILNHTELVKGAKGKSAKDVNKAINKNQLERWANDE